jgi:hypothetical protein
VRTSAERQIGIAAVVAAVVALAFAHVINNEPGEDGDWAFFIVASVVAALVGALIFGRVVPRAKASAQGNRAARAGLAISVLGLLTAAAFRTGLPWVLGTGGALLGWIGEARSPESGHRGLAVAALLVGALAVALATVAIITDEVG